MPTSVQLFPFFINVKKRLCFGIKRKTQEDVSLSRLTLASPITWIVNAYHPYLCVAISWRHEPVQKNRRNGFDSKSQGTCKSDVTGIYCLMVLIFSSFWKVRKNRLKWYIGLYAGIPRHYNIVELLCDYAPARRFGEAEMELFDLHLHRAG